MKNNRSKILVVDDEPEVADTLQHFLSVRGYDVKAALDGEAALNILERNTVDLVLLDIVMPGIQGSEVAKIIRGRHPNTKLVVITGYPKEGEILKKDNLLEALFLKPIRLYELYSKLLEILSQKELSEQDLYSEQKACEKRIAIKANVLFVGASFEEYNFLSAQFKQLTYRGQFYELDMARNEDEIIKKIRFLRPDVIVFDVTYYNNLDIYFTERIYRVTDKRIAIIPSNLTYSVYDCNELEKLIEKVRLTCIKNGLFEFK